MCRFVRRNLLIAVIPTLFVLCEGCQRQNTAPSVAETPAKSNPEPAPEEPDVHEEPFELEQGFVLLARDDFDAFNAEPGTWTATSEGIESSGKPKGYLYSKQPYENFTLKLEYRFPRPEKLKDDSKFKGNTGFLVYITGEHKQWPICIEVQGKYVQMAAIKENGGAEPVVTEDNEEARQKARKLVGQWNSLEIVSKDGALNVSLNGTPVSSSQPGKLTSGLIGIQAEDFPFEVRRMRIHSE